MREKMEQKEMQQHSENKKKEQTKVKDLEREHPQKWEQGNNNSNPSDVEGERRDDEVILNKQEYEHLISEAQKAKMWYEKCLRIQADYENAKKRLEREREDFIKFAQFTIIREFLQVLDDFERAKESACKTKDVDALIKGLEMIGKDLYSLLQRYGVKEIEAEGKAFNPEFHEAMLQEERSDLPENTVIEVLQKGYIMHDKVLRPARVKVSKKN